MTSGIGRDDKRTWIREAILNANCAKQAAARHYRACQAAGGPSPVARRRRTRLRRHCPAQRRRNASQLTRQRSTDSNGDICIADLERARVEAIAPCAPRRFDLPATPSSGFPSVGLKGRSEMFLKPPKHAHRLVRAGPRRSRRQAVAEASGFFRSHADVRPPRFEHAVQLPNLSRGHATTPRP